MEGALEKGYCTPPGPPLAYIMRVDNIVFFADHVF